MACGPVFSAETMASTANHALDSRRILLSNLLFVDRYGSVHHFSIAHVSYGCSFSGRYAGSFDAESGIAEHTFRQVCWISFFTGVACLMVLDSSLLPKLNFILGPFAITSSALLFGGHRWNICSRSRILEPAIFLEAAFWGRSANAATPCTFSTYCLCMLPFALLDRAKSLPNESVAALVLIASGGAGHICEWRGCRGSFWRSLFYG